MQFLCEQDQEDFEQDKRIREWLDQCQPEKSRDFDSKYINRKGNARNTLVRAQFSLDQTIRKDDANSGTFADIIGGCDGRDLDNGNGDYHFNEYFHSFIEETLGALGFNEREIKWLKNLWLHSAMPNEWPSLTLMTDLEWENL